ncbi:metallophosphoesterase family protein [Fructobacillus durionis]|uniref:DNA repair exonuclease SbcCD nuclease subunit n=1 Tax=Fructobacillus durionis TaxID=283737 RepID=A0A1I1EEQ1_9LACO|nr:DNA repair exonuclease [Fructobacillus durionis]SFB83403.1 DNA repair exonuclease SbcCD nuclease subunit [Fructobacillus durionis]
MLSFIHAGDVHLGNPFTGLSKNLPKAFQDAVADAGYVAFDRLIQEAIQQQVDFVLFPGDLMHGAGQTARLQATLVKGFLALKEAGIQVVLSFGNHDYQAYEGVKNAWPDNVYVFGQEVQEKILMTRTGERVAFVGFSYRDRSERRDRLVDFPVRNESIDYEVGLYHGAVGQVGDDYAAFSIEEMLQKNYDYWALGHIHIREVLHEHPVIAYSGNLQGLNRKETGPKGALLVRDSGQGLEPTFLSLAPVRFETLEMTDCRSFLDFIGQLKQVEFDSTTLLSIELNGDIPAEMQADQADGRLLDKVQLALPESGKVWPIHIALSHKQKLVKPAFAQMDFDQAIRQTIEGQPLTANLSDEVPLPIRDYFTSKEGQQAVQEALEELFSEGGES